MRRLVTSDWQLAGGARDRYRLDFVKNEIPRLVDKYKVDQLLMLGDLTEEKDNHPAPLVNEIVELFSVLAKKTQVVILQGNHDFLSKAHPFFEFLNVMGVRWISRPCEYQNCLFLPHTRDYKKDWANVDLVGYYDFIFAHNIFTGVKANGQTMAGIPTNIFSERDFVISGDVHEPQSFDVVTYVGAPYLCDHGDAYEPRVLLLDGTNVKSIRVYGVQKRVIEIFWPDGDMVAEHVDMMAEHVDPYDIVKIKVYLQMGNVADWARIRQQVHDWAADHKFVINSIVPIVEYVPGSRPAAVKSYKKTDQEYFDSYVKRAGIDEKTAEVGRALMENISKKEKN